MLYGAVGYTAYVLYAKGAIHTPYTTSDGFIIISCLLVNPAPKSLAEDDSALHHLPHIRFWDIDSKKKICIQDVYQKVMQG